MWMKAAMELAQCLVRSDGGDFLEEHVTPTQYSLP
jgi:hypothetical protein